MSRYVAEQTATPYGAHCHAETTALARACHQNVVQPSFSSCSVRWTSHGSRSQSGQKKRFSDHVKAILKKCNIPADRLESLAADRSTWRDTCLDRSERVLVGCRGPSYTPACRCRFNAKRPVLPCMQPCVRIWLWIMKSFKKLFGYQLSVIVMSTDYFKARQGIDLNCLKCLKNISWLIVAFCTPPIAVFHRWYLFFENLYLPQTVAKKQQQNSILQLWSIA